MMEMEKEKDNLYVEENHELEEGVTTKMTTKKKKKKSKKKKKMSGEHDSREFEGMLIEVSNLKENDNDEEGNVAVKKDKKTKKTKKKKKVRSGATENVEDSKMELDREFMQELPDEIKPKPDSNITESCKEMVLEEKKINRKKKRYNSPKNNDLDKNTLVVGLSMAAQGNNEAISEHNKIKRKKKKRCLVSGSVDMEQKTLEEAMRELMVKVKPAAAVQTEKSHEVADTEMKMIKRKKKKKHNRPECTKMDTKPLEDNLQDLSVKGKPEAVRQAVEKKEEVNTEQKRVKRKNKKQQASSYENCDGNQSQLKGNLEMTVRNTPGNAVLTSGNHEEISAVKKKKMKKKEMTTHEHDGKHQKMLEEGSLELQLSVERDLKDSLLADENHVSRMKDKSTVCKVKASDDASARDLSSKQLVENSGVSSSELLREVKRSPVIGDENKEISATNCKKEKGLCSASIGDTIKDFGFQDGTNKECNSTQIVLALPKFAPIGCTRRKLLILDLNGLLLDIVMVVPRGYKADKRIGPKSVFKRPFCDDFLKFCFERFEVGVWTSRTKRNMDEVVDFLMADTKHKLLFCWDQSHCTMTGFNTIDNRHKPLVCKELRKLWDKHEPNLPWEKREYNESNTLLLDDSPYKALLNPPNTAIFPYSYSLQDMNDNSLGPEGDIRLYLKGLATAEDVQKYVKQHPFGQHAITDTSPSWGFYSRVFDALNSNSINLGSSASPYIPRSRWS